MKSTRSKSNFSQNNLKINHINMNSITDINKQIELNEHLSNNKIDILSMNETF